MALPCASAKRYRLLPEVFDDCSSVRRRLSPRGRAIIKGVNETVFAVNFLEMGDAVDSVISDFRPPSVTESGEAALRETARERLFIDL